MYHLKCFDYAKKKKKQAPLPASPSLPRLSRWYTFVKIVDGCEMYYDCYLNPIDYEQVKRIFEK